MGDLNTADVMTRLIPALAAVVLLPLGVLWLQRRRRGAAPNAIRVTTRAALGRNIWMAVVEVEGRRLLVAAGEKGVNLLTELDPAVPEPSLEAAGRDADPILGGIFMDSEDAEGPRKGLIRKLQDSTLRRAPTSRGPRFELDA